MRFAWDHARSREVTLGHVWVSEWSNEFKSNLGRVSCDPDRVVPR
jgi:hypothetical protein